MAGSSRSWWWWPWSKPVDDASASGGCSSQGQGQEGRPSRSSTFAIVPASAAAPAGSVSGQRPGARGEGPSMLLLGASAVGILGCGVMAGMYRAQRNEEKELLGKKRQRLKPEEQVKHWKRNATTAGPFGIPIPPGFNPTRYAAKALAVGTLLCFSATGALAFVVGRAMGVRDVYEFADVVRAWVPRKRRELEGWLGIKPNAVLEEERAVVARMSYEEEMAHWEKVVLAEGEGGGKGAGARDGKGA